MYLKVLQSGNLQLLTLSGTPTNEELEEAWNDILSEFCALIKTDKSESVFKAWQKVIDCKAKINFCALSISILKIKYVADVAESLMLLGFDLIEDNADREKYLKSVEGLALETQNLSVFLEQYENDYKLLIKEDTSDEEAKEIIYNDHFADLAILSKFMGYRIDKEVISLREYANIFNTFIKYNKKKDGSQRSTEV